MLMISTKCCSRCKVEKLLTDFGMRSAIKEKHLYRSACLVCQSEMSRNYRLNNQEKVKESNRILSKKYYEKNKEIILAKNKTLEEKIKKNEWNRQNRVKNGDVVRQKQRDKWSKRLERNKELYKIRYERDKDYINLKQRMYRKENPEKFSIWRRKSYDKLKSDPIAKLAHTIRGRITDTIKSMGYKKNSSIHKLIGIDYNLLKIYIERKFDKGMNWENHGLYGWHIDHIAPLSSAKTEEELIKLFHYTNLQPLWSKENISKGAKIIEHQLKIAI